MHPQYILSEIFSNQRNYKNKSCYTAINNKILTDSGKWIVNKRS